MINVLVGALIALMGAGFGAFITHFVGERRLTKRSCRALYEELKINRSLLQTELKFGRPQRFYFDSYLAAKSNVILTKMPRETHQKLNGAYVALKQFDDMNLALNLGLQSIKNKESFEETREMIIKQINEVLKDLSASKFIKENHALPIQKRTVK